MVIPWLLAAAVHSHAYADASCELYCLDKAADAELTCGDDTECVRAIEDSFDACLEPCPIEVRVPDRADLIELGLAFAEERFGEVTLIDDQDYQHPDGSLNSILIVVSTDPDLRADTVLEALAAGRDPVEYDGVLRGIELGARLELPPVVGFWEGVPFEYVAHSRIVDPEGKPLEQEHELVGRHGTPVFPVFEYALADGTRLFFDPRRQASATGDDIRFHVNEPLRKSDDWTIHLETTKRQWDLFLAAEPPTEVK